MQAKKSKMIISLSFFVLFLILFSLYGFFSATHPQKYKTPLSPKNFGWEFEEVTLITSDNLRLAAWFVPASPSQGGPSEQKSDQVIILLHGYPFDKANLLNWSQFLHTDFNLFFLDFRYFGNSQGSMTSVGYHEQKDLQATLAYLTKRGYRKIGTMGFSLGGAVALLTGAKDSRIKAVVSDSAFANLDLMSQEYYESLFVFKYPLTFLTKLWARVFIDVNPDDIAPEKAAKNIKIPVLLIHSKKDEVISFENALQIQKSLKNNPKAEFLFLEEGIHGGLPEGLEKEYQEKIISFFKKNL